MAFAPINLIFNETSRRYIALTEHIKRHIETFYAPRDQFHIHDELQYTDDTHIVVTYHVNYDNGTSQKIICKLHTVGHCVAIDEINFNG